MKYKSISESDIKRIVKKIISEENESTVTDLPLCVEKMRSDSKYGEMGGSESITFNGTVSLKNRGSVAPQYRGIEVSVNGKPFCFIPKR